MNFTKKGNLLSKKWKLNFRNKRTYIKNVGLVAYFFYINQNHFFLKVLLLLVIIFVFPSIFKEYS